MVDLDFSRCRSVWIPSEERWNPPPPHVIEGVRWIIERPYALLATDMGGMKSAQACIAFQFLHDADVIDRVIIVAPAAVRPMVWFSQEIGQIAEQAFDDKRITVSEFHQKIKQWTRGPKNAKELKIIVSNYEYMRTNWPALIPYCGPKTFLILDESSAVRGDSAQTDAMMKLRWLTNKKGNVILGAPRCGRILEMNGTPVAESPMDLFYQANLLHPDILDCRYKSHFKARYAISEPVLERGKPMIRYGKPVTSVAGWSEEGIIDLQKRLAPYTLRREAKDFGIDFALPPVALEVRLSKEEWAHYTAMRDQMCVWLEQGVVAAHQAGVKSIRLSQITSGFLGGVEDPMIGDDEFEETDLGPMPDYIRGLEGQVGDVIELAREMGIGGLDERIARVEALRPRNQVVEIGRSKLDFALAWHAEKLRQYPDLKLLVWCRFVDELRRYLSEVKALTPDVGAACGSSVLGLGKRQEREAALRMLHPKTASPGACTVGATQGTGAMGLNMTACRTVMDMSFDFSSFKKKQGDARVNRTGQTGPVSFFYLLAVGPKGQRTIDHHVFMQRTGKMQINDLTTAGWCKLLMEE